MSHDSWCVHVEPCVRRSIQMCEQSLVLQCLGLLSARDKVAAVCLSLTP